MEADVHCRWRDRFQSEEVGGCNLIDAPWEISGPRRGSRAPRGGGGGGEHWQDRPSRCVLGMSGSRTPARDMTRGDTYNQSSEVEEHGHGRSKRRRVLPMGWTLAAGCGGTAARVRTKPNHRHLGVAPRGGRVAYGHHRRRRPRDTGTRTTPAREVTRPVQPPHLPIAPIPT